ncbi:MAG: IclR family transcriptional regulator [Rhizobiales bacterium]|nr:IclR family transcriptional regulator [Hyphomicrobiales bacterium]
MSNADVQSVKSGARILDLMELIASKDDAVGLAEVVTTLGIPKSSALMLLRTLVAKHYVEREADGRYRLGRAYRASNNDWVGGRTAILRRVARPLMEELCQVVQETVVVAILTPAIEIQIIEKVRSPQPVRYEIEVGVPYPAYCTAIGRAILGFSDPALVEHYLRTASLVKCTDRTATDIGQLRKILARVREQGYAINIEEHIQGASSIAAPLRNATGEVLGALNIGCVTAHFSNNEQAITDALVATTARLNDKLRSLA